MANKNQSQTLINSLLAKINNLKTQKMMTIKIIIGIAGLIALIYFALNILVVEKEKSKESNEGMDEKNYEYSKFEIFIFFYYKFFFKIIDFFGDVWKKLKKKFNLKKR